MKRPILIIASGVVVIALLLLVNEKWIKKDNTPKTADKQQESGVEQQDSPREQKTKAKPTTKPPVYDLSQKAHWYDPETTIGFWGSSKTLAEWLEPFNPTPEEFQFIAQYERSYKELKESMSEDEYYSVEGRKQIIDEILKLNKQLREDLGEDRHKFYAEVRELGTGYYDTWKVLTANGISEERVSEFRELAEEFNQQMHGIPLYRAERDVGYYLPNDFNIDHDQQRRIAQIYRDRIENEFGKQVLDDILSLRGSTFFMDQLDLGDPRWIVSLIRDPKKQDRLSNLYDVDYNLNDDNSDDGALIKWIEEGDRQEKREIKLWDEWAKKYGAQQAGPREPPIGWIP